MKFFYQALATAIFSVVLPLTVQASVAWIEGVPAVIYPMGDGSFVLGFNANVPVCSSAGSTRYIYVTPGENGTNIDGAKNMLATALTAYALGQSIAVAYDDSSLYCYANRLSMQL